MNLLERIYQKIQLQERNYLPTPTKVILGREEYMEWIKSRESIFSMLTGSEPTVFGLKIVVSRRPRYLCVVSKKPRQRKGRTIMDVGSHFFNTGFSSLQFSKKSII